MGAFNVNTLAYDEAIMTLLYNDTCQHSMPIILNLLNNVLYRMYVDSTDEPIEIRTHPFQQTIQPQQLNIGSLTSAIFVGMVFVLLPVSLAIDIVYDREMKAKNQLRVNGLSTTLYFIAYMIVLTGLMIILWLALMGLIFLIDIPAFRKVCK